MSKTPSPKPQWLDEFSLYLTSRSDRVYNNGRQQLELTVLIIPADGQTLSDAQFDSIGLAYQSENGEWLDLAQQDAAWFYETAHDPRYDHYPSITDMSEPVVVPAYASHGCLKRLYVRCSAAQGESINVRGTIMGATDTVFSTPEHVVTLIAEQSPTYGFPEDYEWLKRTRVGDRLFEGSDICDEHFIIEHTLRPKHVAFSSAQLAQPVTHSGQLIRWGDIDPSANRASLVSLAFPGSADVTLTSTIQADPALSQRLVKQPISSSQGQIVVVLQGEPEVPRTLSGNAEHAPLQIEAYDRHGARHPLSIDFKTPDDRFELDVASTFEAELQDVANISYFRVAGLNSSTDGARCPLYNNGRQQTYVQVIIEATDERDQVITIPDSVINKITLVDYNTGAALPGSYTISRSRSAVDKRFVYYPTQIAGDESSAAETLRQSVTFYIKTSTTENRRIAAKLIHGGKTYHTYDPSLPAGDGKTQSGRSNTSAMIEPKIQNYHFEQQSDYVGVQKDLGVGLDPYISDVDRFEVRLKEGLAHHLVYSRHSDNHFGWFHSGNAWKYNWIYMFQFNGNTSRKAVKGAIYQNLTVPDNAFCLARVRVTSVNWSDGAASQERGCAIPFVTSRGTSIVYG
ncbi:hypothetical protein [Pseudomonas sp. REB1044]|uniref:hypothetical protein n=1 Tax=Pseudomonas sp. REB1044 TaxID=2675224 RepID=UPI00315D806B